VVITMMDAGVDHMEEAIVNCTISC